jgi:RES domain-containing protein
MASVERYASGGRTVSVRAWRIFNHHRARAEGQEIDPLGGHEALHAAGRWHHRGTRVVYASSSTGLALLEVLVHLDGDSPDAQTLAAFDIPDDAIERVAPETVEALVRRAPSGDPQRGTRDFGAQWAREARSLALLTPSVIVPHDCNVVINPLHPRADEVRLVGCEVVTLDERLRRGS